jgi:predicted nucleic acid-binding protein
VQPVVLDTDVASLIHKHKLPDSLAVRLVGRRPVLTFVTLGELTKWIQIRQWGIRSRQEFADWLSPFVVLPGDDVVAVTWGRLSAAAHQRGRPRPMNDMWIAACCLTHDLPLATSNVKDYVDFVEYHGLRLLAAE